jgi:hypothetical protein
MQNINTKATTLFSGMTFITGVICTGTSAIGIFWLSKILPGIYHILGENGLSFMSNTFLFHIVWAVFFLSLLITGIKLLISALNKKTKDLVPGVPLYFVGASLVIIGLFYLVFGQFITALLSIVAGVLCIYIEGTSEIA